MKKQVIICDVDGVLLKWQSMLPFFAQEKGIFSKNILEVMVTEEFMHTKDLFKVTTEYAQKLKKEYHNSHWMRYLTAYDDALDVLNNHKDEFDFIAVTSLDHTENALVNRTYNLNVLFPGVFKEIHLVDNCKEIKLTDIIISETLKGNQVVAFVDDLEHNCQAFVKAVRNALSVEDPELFSKLSLGLNPPPKVIQLARGPRDSLIDKKKSSLITDNWVDTIDFIKG